MLDSAHIAAIVPVSDIETAIEFCEGKLGLRLDRRRDALPQDRAAELSAGSGSLLLYESVGAGKSRDTIAGFRVGDLDSLVAALRERSVVFEEYDLPEVKTEGGIVAVGEARAAWCKDPEGNILAVASAGR